MASKLEQNSFLFGANATFIAELYGRYLDDPGSIDSSWTGFFAELDDDARAVLDDLRGASWSPRVTRIIGDGGAMPGVGRALP